MGGTIGETGVATGATPDPGLQCLLCAELHIPDPDGNGLWLHGFHLGSAEFCEDNPGAGMCRACGDTSECHDWFELELHEIDPIYVGRCHQPCAPSYVLLELSSEVSQLASRLDTRSMTTLAQMIAREPHLEFDANRNAVQLLECGGGVKQEWTVESQLLLPAVTAMIHPVLAGQ